MMWQAVVFSLQILLLATGWVLFQRARAELSAHAAETPVLSEVRALQRNVKQLLAEIEATSDRTSARLETRCTEARELLTDLNRKLEQQTILAAVPPPVSAVTAAPAPVPAPKRTRKPKQTPDASSEWMAEPTAVVAAPAATVSTQQEKRQTVYKLAEAGQAPAAIARETGLSEGEIEMLLSLRGQRVAVRK